MARRMKGGFGETEGYGLGLPFLLLLIGLGAIIAFLVMVPTKDKFTPVAPSTEGDKKAVTPSGNVILY